jgi:hypothetical protein
MEGLETHVRRSGDSHHRRHRRLRRSHYAVPAAMARKDQYCVHESDHPHVFRLASGFRHSHTRGSQVGEGLPNPCERFRAPNGFIVALTYSSQSEWVKNVLAAGGCELKTRGKKYQLSSPKVGRDPTRGRFPFPARTVLRIVGADEYMELSIR